MPNPMALASMMKNLIGGLPLDADMNRVSTLSNNLMNAVQGGASPDDPSVQGMMTELQNLANTSPSMQRILNQNPDYIPQIQQATQGLPSSAQAQPQAQQPSVPVTPQANPPSVPIDTPPLPNIPGLSTPQPQNTSATPQQTPVNVATVPSADISPYIPTTSQQQQDIINQSIAQSQGVAQQNVQSLTDILNPYVTSQMKNWTDPNSPDYQATMGQLNNFGRADPNTFAQSLSSRLAPLIGQNMMNLGTSALQPSFSTQQGLVNSGAGTQSNLGLASLQRFIDQQNFGQQSTLANQLADKGQPSNFQQGVGGASSLLGGLGGLFQGLPGLKQATSGTWICTHLKNLGLATQSEVEAVHARLRSTIVRHPIDWIHYVLCAPRLIVLADEEGVDWQAVKEILIDAVLSEQDSEKAFQLYRSEVRRLAMRYAPELWTLKVVA